MTTEFKIDTADERTAAAERAAADEKALAVLLELLSGPSRLQRQKAAATIALMAQADASPLLPHAGEICEGLNRPEAQTRWEVLHALDFMGKAGQRYGEDVIAAAEDALYDEDNGIVREAAFRFFCGYGAASQSNSDEVWEQIDEAIQCYHGNTEFADMLVHLVAFAEGDISDAVSAALAERMSFDADNGSGTLRMRSQQIVAAHAARA